MADKTELPSEDPKSEPVGNAAKDPDDWVTGDEPMTGAQESYLSTLAQEAGEKVEDGLTKAEASKKIDDLQGAALASDAFFPFPDGPQAAIDAGITSIIQPGGSKRDHEVAEAADAAGISMVFTHRRHFKH